MPPFSRHCPHPACLFRRSKLGPVRPSSVCRSRFDEAQARISSLPFGDSHACLPARRLRLSARCVLWVMQWLQAGAWAYVVDPWHSQSISQLKSSLDSQGSDTPPQFSKLGKLK